LQQVQYRTDANLAARQSLYAYQYPRIDLPAAVLGLSSLRGQEIVADIGCGNGAYLAELARRRHTGPVVGVDLSAGMLAAARRRAPAAALTAADAAALPLRDHAVSLTLAAHMLYHIPDSRAAAGELRRITRPGGQVLVVLNGRRRRRAGGSGRRTCCGRRASWPITRHRWGWNWRRSAGWPRLSWLLSVPSGGRPRRRWRREFPVA
jgi:SAM-dependent methyltransferase